ncbi:hypothetical protein FB107DRAFT_218943, partial [Schizophyllum commune]
SCSCVFSVVSDPAPRPLRRFRRGDIMGTTYPLLHALKPVAEPRIAALNKFRRERADDPSFNSARPFENTPYLQRTNAASVNSLASYTSVQSQVTLYTRERHLRPCVIWEDDSTEGEDREVEVLLMGTLQHSSWDRIPSVLKEYVIGNANRCTVEDAGHVDHIHTSPTWPSRSAQWLISLPVSVPARDLEPFHNEVARPRDGEEMCCYVNVNSLEVLSGFHKIVSKRLQRVYKSKDLWVQAAEDLSQTTSIASYPYSYDHRLISFVSSSTS